MKLEMVEDVSSTLLKIQSYGGSFEKKNKLMFSMFQ